MHNSQGSHTVISHNNYQTKQSNRNQLSVNQLESTFPNLVSENVETEGNVKEIEINNIPIN